MNEINLLPSFALCLKDWIDCKDLPLRNSEEQVKDLWVRIWDRTNNGHLVVGAHYRPPDQGEPADNAFFLQLQKASCSGTSPCQPPRYLLGKLYSKLQEIQETFWSI